MTLMPHDDHEEYQVGCPDCQATYALMLQHSREAMELGEDYWADAIDEVRQQRKDGWRA